MAKPKTETTDEEKLELITGMEGVYDSLAAVINEKYVGDPSISARQVIGGIIFAAGRTMALDMAELGIANNEKALDNAIEVASTFLKAVVEDMFDRLEEEEAKPNGN